MGAYRGLPPNLPVSFRAPASNPIKIGKCTARHSQFSTIQNVLYIDSIFKNLTEFAETYPKMPRLKCTVPPSKNDDSPFRPSSLQTLPIRSSRRSPRKPLTQNSAPTRPITPNQPILEPSEAFPLPSESNENSNQSEESIIFQPLNSDSEISNENITESSECSSDND
jgi:hypothetical protein